METDFPDAVADNIALIQRGSCDFGLKVAYAGAAGAAGVVIYNNAVGNISGTLGLPREQGPYVPAVSISQASGAALVAAIGNGSTVIGDLDTFTVIENRTTSNVIAQTTRGDQNNVVALGAHSDSVEAGPGINDDGSGTSGILEVAIQLAKYNVKNSVRFGWWSGEEEGLLGSTFYVESLSEEELAKIRVYLNFDMIASPNYIYAIYDGDGSSFNITGPQGSAEVEALYQKFFTKKGQNFTATAFDGRSDYGPFLDAGIASGGLFTGAEELKTAEWAEQFGGEAGVALDANYHQAGDNITNLNSEAFLINAQGIAYSVATYALSLEGLHQNTTSASTRRSLSKRSAASKMGGTLPSFTAAKRRATKTLKYPRSLLTQRRRQKNA
jgi:Zn-dependent M28 family amino/carboxypeptidase